MPGYLRPFDPHGAFRHGIDERGLRRLAVRGAAATTAAQALMLAAQLISTVILARLLTPADFGVVGMVTTFSFLLASFGGNGFNEAIIQRVRIDHHLASNVFWINTVVGLVLTGAFAASGSLLARFYRNPLLTHVVVASSLGIFVAAMPVVHLALLRRAMRFTAVSANDVIGRAANTCTAIVLALQGWGYWALVAGMITQAISTAIGAFWLCRWIPGLPSRRVGTRAMLRFSANVYGRFTATYLARNCDNALVGWRFDAQALGFYKKAYDLFALPAGQFLSPLTSVALATLSRVKGDAAQFRRYILEMSGIMTFFGLGLGTISALIGPDVIYLVLGPGWERAGRIFAYFGPGMGIMFLSGITGWIHLSLGRPERWLRWGLFECGFTLMLFVLGLRWGPDGVALAWTASLWILTLPALWYAGQPVGLVPLGFIRAVWRYMLAACAAGVVCYTLAGSISFLVPSTNGAGAFSRALATSFLFLLLYLGAVVILHGGLEPIRRVKRLAAEVVTSKNSRQPRSDGAVPALKAESVWDATAALAADGDSN